MISSGLQKIDNAVPRKSSPRMTGKFSVDDGYGTNYRPVKFKLEESFGEAERFDSKIGREFFQDLFMEQNYAS